MQIQSRFQILHSSSKRQDLIEKLQRRIADSDYDRGQGRTVCGGLQRGQNTYLSTQEETGRGLLSRHLNQGSVSLQKFIHYFDHVSSLPFHDFAHHKRAKAEQVKYRALFTALARRIGLFSFPHEPEFRDSFRPERGAHPDH